MKNISIKTFLFFGIFFVGFLFLLTRCQKNNIAKKANENYIEKAKAWFDAHPKINQFAVLSFSEKPNWDKAFYHKRGDKVAVEIPVKLKKGMAVMIHDTVNQNVINRIVFVIDKENTVKSFYELIKPENEHIETPQEINYFNVPNNFRVQ
jgi:hypothetical protein